MGYYISIFSLFLHSLSFFFFYTIFNFKELVLSPWESITNFCVAMGATVALGMVCESLSFLVHMLLKESWYQPDIHLSVDVNHLITLRSVSTDMIFMAFFHLQDNLSSEHSTLVKQYFGVPKMGTYRLPPFFFFLCQCRRGFTSKCSLHKWNTESCFIILVYLTFRGDTALHSLKCLS